MDYDNWKLATPPHYEYDDEEQEEEKAYETLYDAYDSNDVEVFEEMYCGIANELKIVYEALKATDHGMANKVLSIIEKIG